VDPGWDLVVDGPDHVDRHAVAFHDLDREVGEALGVRQLGRALQRAVHVEGVQVGEVPGALAAQLLVAVAQGHRPALRVRASILTRRPAGRSTRAASVWDGAGATRREEVARCSSRSSPAPSATRTAYAARSTAGRPRSAPGRRASSGAPAGSPTTASSS